MTSERRRGVALLEDGRRAALAAWLVDELPAHFARRLPIALNAERWSDMMVPP